MKLRGNTTSATGIGRNRLGRRNLTDFQRVELALMMKPIIEGRARAQQATSAGGVAPQLRQTSDEAAPIRTDDAVADMAGVSRDTAWKAAAIRESAAPGVVEPLGK